MNKQQLLFPQIAEPERLSPEMAEALMLLEVEYAKNPDATLTEDEVRAFIRTTPYAHVVDDFRDYFLLWDD